MKTQKAYNSQRNWLCKKRTVYKDRPIKKQGDIHTEQYHGVFNSLTGEYAPFVKLYLFILPKYHCIYSYDVFTLRSTPFAGNRRSAQWQVCVICRFFLLTGFFTGRTVSRFSVTAWIRSCVRETFHCRTSNVCSVTVKNVCLYMNLYSCLSNLSDGITFRRFC